MKTIITLFGKSFSYDPASVSSIPQLIENKMIRYTGTTGCETRLLNAEENVNLSNEGCRNAIQFNLPTPSQSLVTVYDPEGKIISIQRCESYQNLVCLALNNYEGNFIVRVQVMHEITA